MDQAVVQVNGNRSEAFMIERSGWQGYSLSPLMSSLWSPCFVDIGIRRLVWPCVESPLPIIAYLYIFFHCIHITWVLSRFSCERMLYFGIFDCCAPVDAWLSLLYCASESVKVASYGSLDIIVSILPPPQNIWGFMSPLNFVWFLYIHLWEIKGSECSFYSTDILHSDHPSASPSDTFILRSLLCGWSSYLESFWLRPHLPWSMLATGTLQLRSHNLKSILERICSRTRPY